MTKQLTRIEGIGITVEEARALYATSTERARAALDAVDVPVTVQAPECTITLPDGRTVRFYSLAGGSGDE